MFAHLFDERKAAHVAAYFAIRNGGSINKLALAKLLYLAERDSYAKYGEPMIGDLPVSMPHGPVLSKSLNLTNSGGQRGQPWNDLLHPSSKYLVALKDGGLDVDDLGHLSRADVRILEDLWSRFGHMDGFQIRDWTHDNCAEYQETSSSIPIAFEDLLGALGYSDAELREIEEHLRSQSRLSGAFARALAS